MNKKFDVIFIFDGLEGMFKYYIFNLRKDFKNLNIKSNDEMMRSRIVMNSISEINMGYIRKSNVILFEKRIENIKVIITKTRLSLNDNKSKKDQLRCISLIDELENRCIILHIYMKNKKENISPLEKKMCKNLLDEYIELVKENNYE